MITVLVDRLLKSAQLDLTHGIEWTINSPININRVGVAIRNGIDETNEGFGDGWSYRVDMNKEDDYHLARIVYFINHPEEIKGVEVDNVIVADRYHCSVMPNAKITDGHHRLMAAKHLDLEKIDIRYGGRSDILDYLTGDSDSEPTNMLA
ncbi:hypothetical protein IFU39_16580 [Paenibacillus sp. CFBP 13594]|uniref:hypothetical protein n=1 Tax=Paenibacillus sp. CFBP 13594 TaxID=2774037 RepID=UPI001784F369|nr:hypothetical protein [Paenibacillus sp. CFBP 13594]MBD8839430.1 hypothetical protein [Paenibacillus sp. CFBP 13594]